MTHENEMATWSLTHLRAGILVRVFCPRRQQPHCVAEVQATPYGDLVKLYQRDTRQRGAVVPVGPTDDVSHRLGNPAVHAIEDLRRDRNRYLKARGELPRWEASANTRFQGYAADGLPNDWARTVICRCAQGVITVNELRNACNAARHAGTSVPLVFHDRPR